jgi:NitT/TauT family transport system substrate-binding protein
MKKFVAAAIAAGFVLSTAACGSGSGGAAGGGDAEVTVALPQGGCLSWWELYAAKDQGYFKDAGITPKFQALDGSSAAVQGMLSGKAEIAVTAPDNYLAAVSSGAKATGWYSLFRSKVFSLVTPEDSGVTSVEDLKGKKVGISTPGGGDETYAHSVLSIGAGLDVEKDYKQLAVGDGGSAATALRRGVVDAYSASYYDEELIKAGGIKLNTVESPKFPSIVGIMLVSTNKWMAENSDVVDGFGRAIAKATQWGMENQDKVIDICSGVAPEETEDPKFAKIIFERVAGMAALPKSGDGQYGAIDEKAFTEYKELLIDLGAVPKSASGGTVTNDHVAAWNKK